MDGVVLAFAVIALMVGLLAIMIALSTQASLRELRRMLEIARPRPAATDEVVAAPPPIPVGGLLRAASLAGAELVAPQSVAPVVAEPQPAIPSLPSRPAPSDRVAREAGHPQTVPRTLEERLGASLPIWFGAVALALAGVFLVKHFVDRGLLGPEVRVGIAVGFGVAALALAWRIRPKLPSIAQGLAAAGVAVLSGAVYAASALYGFLSPGWGILAQGAVTALAVFASIRFGPFVALLGIVGGFALPALIGAETLPTAAVFGYLALLQVGLAIFGSRRGWWWLPLVGSAAAFVWAFAWSGLRGEGHSILSPFALLAAGLAIASSRRVTTRIGDGLPTVATIVPWLVAGAAIGLVLEDLRSTVFGIEHWLWAGCAAVATLVLAARDRTLAGLPWLVAVMVGVSLFAPPEYGSGEILRVIGRASPPDPNRAWVVLGYGVLFALGPYLAGMAARAHATVLAWLPAFGTFVALRSLVVGAPRWESSPWPGWLAAVALAVLAVLVDRREPDERRIPRASGLVAAVAIAIGCGVFEGVDERYRVFGLALIPVGIASIAILRGLAPLFRVVAIATAAVLPIALLDQFIERWNDPGLLFSTPSLAFATCAATAFATSRVLRTKPAALRIARAHQSTAVGIAAFEVMFWILRYVDESEMTRAEFWIVASLAAGWLALGQLLFWTAPRWAIDGRERPGSHVTLGGLVVLLLGPTLFVNPLFQPVKVGESVLWNALVLAFGAGVVLATTARRGWASVGAARRSNFAGVVAILSGFLLVTTEVRQVFHGDRLVGSWPELGELYTYSAVWLVYGVVLLAIGVVRQLRPMRLASLVVMLVSVLKVFLIDAGHLDGLWRVLSFFGLGVALFGLAWVYQRFVVGRR